MTLPAKLEDITRATLQALVTDAVRERKTVEYKRDSWDLKSDKGKKEFLSDVVSFANASGGDILVGVEVDDVQKDLPKAIVGIEVADEDSLKLQLQQIVRTGLDPRLPLFELHLAPVDDGRVVLILRVGRSWCGPHMVKETGRFHSRTSNGKFDLDVREIRAAMLATEEVGKRMAEFRADRVARVMADEAAMPLPPGAKFVTHLIPEAAFELGFAVNFGRADALAPVNYGRGLRSHNFDGLASYDARGVKSGLASAYCQLFRNGMVEAVDCFALQGESSLRDLDAERWFVDCIELNLRLLRDVEVQHPVFAACSLVGVRNFKMDIPERELPRGIGPSTGLRTEVLVLPAIRLETADLDVPTAMRPAFDVMWQAFGWPASRNYTEDGKWRVAR